MSPVLLHRLAAALALPLALTACGGDPIAPPPLTPATSTASTPTPTEQPETAEEFIRRWIEAGDAMQNSGDTTAYRALSDRCAPCDSLADRIESIYRRGGEVHTQGLQVLAVSEKGHLEYDVSADSAPTRYREEVGGAVKRFPGGRVTYLFTLSRVGDEWRVHSFGEYAS